MDTKELIREIREQGKQITDIKLSLSLAKPVLNINDVSLLTGLSKSTIYKFTRLGTIPHYKQAKHLYFDREEVIKWLKQNRGFDASMSV